MSDDPLQQEGYDFMAAAFEVYNELGHGFTEKIYQETLENAEHAAQLLNYLKASGRPVGYLVNFGSPDELEWKRFARTRTVSKPISVH